MVLLGYDVKFLWVLVCEDLISMIKFVYFRLLEWIRYVWGRELY